MEENQYKHGLRISNALPFGSLWCCRLSGGDWKGSLSAPSPSSSSPSFKSNYKNRKRKLNFPNQKKRKTQPNERVRLNKDVESVDLLVYLF
jgi:hypothetical protein